MSKTVCSIKKSKSRKTISTISTISTVNLSCPTPSRTNNRKNETKIVSVTEMKSFNTSATSVSSSSDSTKNTFCNLSIPSATRCSPRDSFLSATSPNNLDKNSPLASNNNSSKAQKLDDCLITKTKWHRKFAPADISVSSVPSKGTEIFVGRIPRDLFEDELVPVLQKAGTLYEVRLMMEASGLLNRGFAYVKYTSKEEADNAVKILNNYEIRERQFLGVMKSVDNNRLFVGGIPKNRKREELFEEMTRLTEDVVDVILYPDINDKTKNRGFAFVEYKCHTSAFSARQKMLKTPQLLWGTTAVKVDWAEPEREVDDETMKKVRILYVRNLALTTTDQQLRQLFSSYGDIERVKKIKDYAFIHFATREQAEEAKRNLQGFVLDKCEIDINWSKPVVNREEYQQRKAASKALSSGNNLATSMQATYGLNGEPILVNQRVRTAAGAQGYNASRPYPLRTKQAEEPFSALQPPVIYPNFAYIQDISLRNTIDSYGLASPVPQPIYAAERVNQIEEYVAPHQEVQYHIAQPQLVQRVPNMFATAPYNVVNPPGLGTCWGPQAIIQQTNASPAFISASPFVLPAPSIPGFTPQPFYGGQLMAQIPSVTGSNMSIDRT